MLTWAQVVSAAALTTISITAKYEIPAGASGVGYDLISFIQDQSLWILVVANVILWVAHVLKKYHGNPWAWDTVKVLLEEFRAEVFKGNANLSAHLDRVTLFKKCPRRWRWGFWPSRDWLCSVERTGHMTRRKRVWYRAHDDGKTRTGVVGATWCEGRTILKDGLPLLSGTATTRQIEIYAKETFISTDEIFKKLGKGRTFPRSLCGILVEVSSKPWGVIVIDSQFERLAGQDVIMGFYNKNAKTLAKLLAVL